MSGPLVTTTIIINISIINKLSNECVGLSGSQTISNLGLDPYSFFKDVGHC